MICIIAEKPSLARNIIAAIDPKMKKYDGYYSNDDYIVTYAFGHLFSLYDIEQYDPSYNEEQKKRWTLDRRLLASERTSSRSLRISSSFFSFVVQIRFEKG